MSDTIFDSLNAGYVQALYEEFARNPASVPEEWRQFFSRGFEAALEAGLFVPDALSGNGGAGVARRMASAAPPAEEAPPGAPPPTDPTARPDAPVAAAGPAEVGASAAEAPRRLLGLVARASALVQAFRDHGHQIARIDPLGSDPPGHPQLDPAFFGTSMEELQEIPASVVLGNGSDESLSGVLTRFRETYTGSVGYEFEHLEDPHKARWLWNAVESGEFTRPLEQGEKVALLERLSEVEGLEQFLHRAYLGQKRFSVEGTDMLVPMLDEAIRRGSREGGREVVLGMAHRGRLNVLAHIIRIDYRDIVREFEGVRKKGALGVPDPGTGDVKYHAGAEGDYPLDDGASVRITLTPNPSHLEFVNPVVEGIARAHQFGGGGRDARQDMAAVIPILIHGDAAFAAEGVVAETLNLARLPGFATGGTVHVIVNNQVGFTTPPEQGRSTRYASDVAKGYDIPVLHVNADDPQACIGVVRLAMAYRAKYHDDIVIDLVGYRRHGHNEGDEPSYTQPRLYREIEGHASVRTLWAQALVEAGTVTEEQAREMADRVAHRLREAQDAVRQEAQEEEEAHEEPDQEQDAHESPEADTTVAVETILELNDATLSWPEGFNVHPKLRRQLEKRKAELGPDTRLEWAHAETLAFATLLRQGVPVRMTGQDTERGTFSQRHLVLHDVETGERHVPLASVGEARFELYNSPLTEMAVVGFEYGYSVATDRDLVIWEAQFGDFVNVAQVAVDQFITAGRAKWAQHARLTMLLPHGYEGQGPEHSSARLERFLQLSAENNIRVTYPTTPAQYFHLLRRQALADPERPLVVMTPKSLLRHPRATSTVSELAEGAFRHVLDDPAVEGRREAITRLILCSGKVYYDLVGNGGAERPSHVAIARVEELYPFPGRELEGLVSGYPRLQEAVWTQEEPRNMGALSYIGPRLRAVVPRSIPLRYVARPERASPAEGKAHDHVVEQSRIVRDALEIDRD